MTPYETDYIIPGEVYSDQTVLCMRCGTQILGLSYKPMPKRNEPLETVNVTHRVKWGNYRQLPVVMEKDSRKSIVHLLFCQDCVKLVDPARDSEPIVRLIARAMAIQNEWLGMPENVSRSVEQNFTKAKILRRLTEWEIVEGQILEGEN